jgi:cytochrome c553
MNMKSHLTIGFALVALVSVGAQAADIEKGRAKAKEVCAACHGEDGNSIMPDYPKLAGQHRDYLSKALRDYKSGQRKNPIMAGMVGALTKEDIENVAAYYGSRPALLASHF